MVFEVAVFEKGWSRRWFLEAVVFGSGGSRGGGHRRDGGRGNDSQGRNGLGRGDTRVEARVELIVNNLIHPRKATILPINVTKYKTFPF